MKTNPGKLTPARHKAIVRVIRAGGFKRAAAQAAGIAEETLMSWQRQGRADVASGNTRTKQAKLVLAMEKAESEQIEEMLNRVSSASTNSWQAAAWMLERRHGYHKPAPLQISVSPEKPGEGKGVSELVARLSLGVNSEDDSE